CPPDREHQPDALARDVLAGASGWKEPCSMKPFEPAAPTWVRKRDGRTVPFEADRISRALFAAGEHCGQPDAFKARELADAVVHFLANEADDKVSTTTQVREVVVKVLRQFKQY